MFSWLEYEETAECKAGGAFCFYCRQAKLRKLITTSKCESAFTSVGFHKWKNAVQMYKKHEMTASHKTSVAAVTAVLSNANVGAKISQQAEVIRTQNTKMLTCIFTSLKYLCRQGLAIRGKTDECSNFHQCNEINSKISFFSPTKALISIPLLSCQNELKLTYSNVGIQKFPGGKNPRTPALRGSRV